MTQTPVAPFIQPVAATFADGPNLDAFNRLRVSSPIGIFDDKQIYDNSHLLFQVVTAGSGTSSYQYQRASTYLTVTTANGDRALRQTRRYMTYIPGRGQIILLTAVLGTPKTNCNQYIGYGDDLNGLFFSYQGEQFGIVTRTDTSGSAVDTFIPQSDWNIDRLDGTGPSGHMVDLTKTQIFYIDFQWLGVGRVRFGMVKDGVVTPVHQMLNTNNQTVVYMRSPNLPLRYEIVNTGTTSASTTLESICSSAASEGVGEPNGYDFSAGHGITPRTVSARTPVFAIRLKAEYPVGKPNRRLVQFVSMNVAAASNDAYVELMHVHDPSAITANWVSADNDSAVEYSVNISAVTGNPAHRIGSLTVPTTLAGKLSSSGITGQFVSLHKYISQNYDSSNGEMFLVYATPATGSSDVLVQMDWAEIQ